MKYAPTRGTPAAAHSLYPPYTLLSFTITEQTCHDQLSSAMVLFSADTIEVLIHRDEEIVLEETSRPFHDNTASLPRVLVQPMP